MEMTLRTIVVAILALVLLLVSATLVITWGEEGKNIFDFAIGTFKTLLLGE